MKKSISNYFLALFVFLISLPSLAQGINGYAAVTGVSGTTITINNVNESDDSFEDGEYIIIMQMQDNVIGNTTNTSSFGVLGSIQSAGLYEIREIISHTESSSVPNTITISAGLSNTYNINANASIQIITYPSFGSPNYTTTANMSPPAWNGTVGGVLAMNVPGILTLAHNIDADEDGFRGGGNDPNATTTSGSCQSTVFITTASGHALKGEGIYKNTTASYNFARGKILNGGGGGSGHNGGGAGGGNYAEGGAGGRGYSCRNSTTQSVGGQGGISLSGQISSSRFFLGGGGGAGEQNNSATTSGGAGGGILILKADEIQTLGACGGLTISANGETRPDIGNDGGPGAGAGGSIFFDVNTFNILAGCTVSVESNGGDGSSANTGTAHAGGGGGGQGVVIYTAAQPTTNISTTTTSGTGGCDNSSCTSTGGVGTGTPGAGVIPSGGTGPLPISLVRFDVYSDESSVILEWKTKSEQNNDYFIVDRSRNGKEWEFFTEVKGSGSSIETILYHELDLNPYSGTNYYRLTQVDFDGTYTDLGTRSAAVTEQNNNQFVVYPNPGKNIIHIKNNNRELVRYLSIKNMLGQTIPIEPYWVNGATQVDLGNQPKGMYLLTIKGGNGVPETIKLILEY